MPRIRKDKTTRSYAEPFWKIGLYIRLSREDDNEDESESVINQEKILRDFVDSYFEPGYLCDCRRVCRRRIDRHRHSATKLQTA